MFEWEESVFVGLKSLYQRVVTKPQEREQEARRASLSEQRASLVMLARMLSGENLNIFETEESILCAPGRVCLPPHFHAADSLQGNLKLYRLKTILGALAHRDRWQGTEAELEIYAASLSGEFSALAESIASVERALPPVPKQPVTLWQLLGTPALTTEVNQEVAVPAPDELGAEQVDVTTEIEGRGQMEVAVVPEGDDHGEAMPFHTFEKVETLEETSGLSRRMDDDDELEEHEEALREVDMKEVVRSQERPRSIYRSDIILDGLNLELDTNEVGSGVPYPEWDYRKRQYKEDWCSLRQTRSEVENAAWVFATEKKHAVLIASLKRELASITSEFLKLRRQPSGDDFDLDAVVDAHVELRSGRTPDESIYISRKKNIHDVSTILLLDLSFSTDAWVKDARVLDSILETVYCVGEVIDDAIESFAVAGFSSNTRRSCLFELVKDFHEPWQRTKLRLGSLRPQGYTRIGPALRHSQELLLNQSASRKIVIVVTDGRPCDYDRYEGTYGIRDVRKAIETGKVHGLQTHAFAIEKQATETFPLMFRRDHFDVVQSPAQLTHRMSRLFSKLVAS